MGVLTIAFFLSLSLEEKAPWKSSVGVLAIAFSFSKLSQKALEVSVGVLAIAF